MSTSADTHPPVADEAIFDQLLDSLDHEEESIEGRKLDEEKDSFADNLTPREIFP